MEDGRKTPEETPGYQVGYKKPPLHSRFEKGKSPNPGGRPKKRQSISDIVEKELSRRIPISENGVQKKESVLVCAVRRLAVKAVEGDIRALSKLMEIKLKLEAQRLLEREQLPTSRKIEVTLDFEEEKECLTLLENVERLESLLKKHGIDPLSS